MAVIRRRIARRAVSSHTQRAGRVPYGESRFQSKRIVVRFLRRFRAHFRIRLIPAVVRGSTEFTAAKKLPNLPNVGDARRRVVRLTFHPSCIAVAGSRPARVAARSLREGVCRCAWGVLGAAIVHRLGGLPRARRRAAPQHRGFTGMDGVGLRFGQAARCPGLRPARAVRVDVCSVPIRLMQTHTTCRMLPLSILRTQSTPSGCMRKADRHGLFRIEACLGSSRNSDRVPGFWTRGESNNEERHNETGFQCCLRSDRECCRSFDHDRTSLGRNLLGDNNTPLILFRWR